MTTAMPASEMKSQQKMPTSMRYERVQTILESEPAFCTRIGPKTYPVNTRFGEQLCFSKEVVEITNALHLEGKDAHKVPKNAVLKVAIRIMGVGDDGPMPVSPPAQVVAPPAATSPPAALVAPAPEKAKKKVSPAKVSPPPAPVKAAAAAAAAVAPPPKKQAKKVEAEPVDRRTPKPVAAAPVVVVPVAAPVPTSELPPERQPLCLPPDFDPRQYPHYSVQCTMYSLLLSALSMSDHYERFPGKEERQKKLDELVIAYQNTCDPLRIKSPDAQGR